MALPLRNARTLLFPLFPGAEEARPAPDLPAGVLVELSGERRTARLSSAVSALRAAQAGGETAAWIQRADGSLYPPDLAEAGVDLDALVVVRVPAPGTVQDIARAVEMLVRSGAFGLVIVDLRRECAAWRGTSRAGGATSGRLPSAWQGRLLAAAREHGSRIVFLSSHRADQESVGALVGLRLEPQRVRFAPGLFAIEHGVLKNKPGLPFAEASEHRRGPWGLR